MLDLPPFEQVSSFEEYMRKYPYSDGIIFSEQKYLITEEFENKISILINNDIYSDQIKTKLNQYIQDLSLSSYSLLNLDTLYGGNPEKVKDWVIDQYEQGASGVLFIGDIPAAFAEVSSAIFPCDLYYMDLDGTWKDDNNDDIYEIHSAGSGDMGPELFVSRFFISPLTWNSEEKILLDYFDKVHKYKNGGQTIPWRGLEYVEEDWYSMDIDLDIIFDDNLTRYDFGYFTTGSDYLSKLQQGQHFVTVCAHSYPGGHHFGRRPTQSVTYAHVYVYSPEQQEGKILVGSDDGIIAWLNGEEIIHHDAYHGWTADRHIVDITLHQGWNRLLCKVSQESGDHQLSVKFTDDELNLLPDLKFQVDNPEIYEGQGEFIRNFLINGFHQDSSDSFYQYLETNYLGVNEATVIPREGEIMGGKEWVQYPSSAPYIDFDTFSDSSDYGVCYAFVTIESESDINCELWTGYDDGMRAWLNGEQIIFDNRYGGYSADMKKIDVTLHEGENHLLFKVSEWMGNHGFSSRFCASDGARVEGLTFYPSSDPISYIGEWLVTGPFTHENSRLRLTTEYIDNEKDVTPSEGDISSNMTWQKAIGDGYPFDINVFFDHGDWVYSQDIQRIDPPVNFYNLFACSAGRFTDENYLSGSYIFNTTNGLVCIASSKSGSMLNFYDFSTPLSQGRSFGKAFIDWFDAQAPYLQWEKEWYYGMTLSGDPTLSIRPLDAQQPAIDIVSPSNGLFFNDKKLLPFFTPVIFGDVSIEIDVLDQGQGIEKILFFINDELIYTDEEEPFEYVYSKPTFGKQLVTIEAYDAVGSIVEDRVIFWSFF